VSSYNIKKSLREIDEVAYRKCLFDLAAKKWQLLKEEQWINRLTKTTQYLLQKGYESNLIKEAIDQARSKENK